MSISRKVLQGLVIASAFGLFCCAAARAEDKPTVASAAPAASSSSTAAVPAEESATVTDAAAQSSAGPTAAAPADEIHDKQWHYDLLAYLCVPTIHGETGVRDYDKDIHVTASDLFSNFRGGFLGVFTPSYNRFSAPIDFIWMRLRPSTQIPFNPNYSLRATINMVIATPKVAYLMVNNP